MRVGQGILDPSHPATKADIRRLPQVDNRYFRLRAVPNGLLELNLESTGSPSWPKVDVWASRITRATESRKESIQEEPNTISQAVSNIPPLFLDFVSPPLLIPHPKGSIPMSLYFSIGKARTHKHATKRRRLRTKIKEAINLIVTRGASVDEETKEMTFNKDEVQKRGHKWILPDWAYLCYPNPEVYLAPYPDLIKALRGSLQQIWDSGMCHETGWAEGEMQMQRGFSSLGPESPQESNKRPHKGRRSQTHDKNRGSSRERDQITSNAGRKLYSSGMNRRLQELLDLTPRKPVNGRPSSKRHKPS
ncbi:hypothetical protein AN958_07343 [Leucoagaricus sp. SymC.cos]|nr:hypothetical protein AN958_07343 [Leucoagaricus sp. SymC.cos]